MLRDTRIAIVHCLVIGYLPAALLYAMRSARRTVLVLQKVNAKILHLKPIRVDAAQPLLILIV